MVFASFNCLIVMHSRHLFFSDQENSLMDALHIAGLMSIFFLIGRIYFNQSEQCSTAVNINGGLLSKHFWVNDKHDKLVPAYTNCSGPMIKMATMLIFTGIKTFYRTKGQ